MTRKANRTNLLKYSRDAETWLSWADCTHRGAEVLFNMGDPSLWFPAAILGHQALEMYLKAALIRTGRRVAPGNVWGHDLLELADMLASSVGPFPPTFRKQLKVFNDYFNELRYPQGLSNVKGLGEGEGLWLDSLVKMLGKYASG
jgi:HEPN domain-containing protein